jgi:hypothetical protein
VHEKENGEVDLLTKGDNNAVDDRGLYAGKLPHFTGQSMACDLWRMCDSEFDLRHSPTESPQISGIVVNQT